MSEDINALMAEALDKAKELVTGERQKDYGTPRESFSRIAYLWMSFLDVNITAEDAAIMMALLKIARLRGGRKTPDTYHDLLGYGAIAYALRPHPEQPDMMPIWKHISKKSSCVAHRKLSVGTSETKFEIPWTSTVLGEQAEIRISEDISIFEGIGLFVEAMAIQADIEAMKANDRRAEVIDHGFYTEKAYFEKADELRKIAARLKGNGNG